MKLRQTLEFADLMAVLMVAATAMSAYATWRTAQVSSLIFTAAERPYIGVQGVNLTHTNSRKPRIAIEFRDFSHIPAENVEMAAKLKIDDRQVDPEARQAGILSPQVPHFMYLELGPEAEQAIASGRSRLTVEVSFFYSGPSGHRHCYHENFVYDPESGAFDVAGGSTRCGS